MQQPTVILWLTICLDSPCTQPLMATHNIVNKKEVVNLLVKHSNDFFVLKWSPLLPDLNLIEHLWDVDSGVKQHGTHSRAPTADPMREKNVTPGLSKGTVTNSLLSLVGYIAQATTYVAIVHISTRGVRLRVRRRAREQHLQSTRPWYTGQNTSIMTMMYNSRSSLVNVEEELNNKKAMWFQWDNVNPHDVHNTPCVL